MGAFEDLRSSLLKGSRLPYEISQIEQNPGFSDDERRELRLIVKQIKRIFLLNRRGLGDMVWLIPLVNSLHKAYPDARIEIATQDVPSVIQLVESIGKSVFPTEKRMPSSGSQDRFAMLLRAAHQIGDKNAKAYYDMAIVNDVIEGKDYDLAILLRRHHGIIFKKPYLLDKISGIQLNLLDLKGKEMPHMVDCCLQFCDILNIKKHADFTLEKIDYDKPITLSSKEEINLKPGTYALLLLQAGVANKKWSKECFNEISKYLKSKGMSTVLIGSKEEFEDAKRIDATINTVIKEGFALDIHNFARLAKKSGLVIACDTGLMHLADALSAKVIALFGPTDSERLYPYNNKMNVVQRNKMDEIKPEDVVSKINEILHL